MFLMDKKSLNSIHNHLMSSQIAIDVHYGLTCKQTFTSSSHWTLLLVPLVRRSIAYKSMLIFAILKSFLFKWRKVHWIRQSIKSCPKLSLVCLISWQFLSFCAKFRRAVGSLDLHSNVMILMQLHMCTLFQLVHISCTLDSQWIHCLVPHLHTIQVPIIVCYRVFLLPDLPVFSKLSTYFSIFRYTAGDIVICMQTMCVFVVYNAVKLFEQSLFISLHIFAACLQNTNNSYSWYSCLRKYQSLSKCLKSSQS